MTKTRLVLCDLDGTLIDSEIGIIGSAQHGLDRTCGPAEFVFLQLLRAAKAVGFTRF